MPNAVVSHKRKRKIIYHEEEGHSTPIDDNDENHERSADKDPASFIDERDHVPLILCSSMYEDIVTEERDWVLQPEGTPSVRYWLRGEEAIVGIMGTSSKTALSNLIDDASLAGYLDGQCDLSVVEQAVSIIKQIKVPYITVAGHSLGGAGAFCIANQFENVRAVSFNMGAPPMGGPVQGAGRARCRAYHIVGDIISTHIDDSTADVTRIHIGGDVDWSKVKYYHTTARFFEGEKYTLWSAQQEQDSIVNYIYNLSPSAAFISTVTGLVASAFNKDRIREMICQNPIPNTKPNCPELKNPGRTIATLAGGLAGGFLGSVGGYPGAALGAKLGYDIGGGTGVLDYLGNKVLSKVGGLVFRNVARVGKRAVRLARAFRR